MRICPISYSKGGGKLILGNIGLKALKAGRLFFKQYEASRRVISRKIKKKSRIWFRSFPDIPLSRKPSEIRMGKGKGAPHT
jgi:large subunit ribosomal protein L16